MGGLLSYGPDLIDQYRGAAGYVDRILRGDVAALMSVMNCRRLLIRSPRRRGRARSAVLQGRAPWRSWLLRPCRERPRNRRPAEQRDELPPFHARAHSITSSAATCSA